MFVLIGETYEVNNITPSIWVVGYSNDYLELNERVKKIQSTINKFNCFVKFKGPFIEKADLSYKDCLNLKEILKHNKLDLNCEYIASGGINYKIQKVERIEEFKLTTK